MLIRMYLHLHLRRLLNNYLMINRKMNKIVFIISVLFLCSLSAHSQDGSDNMEAINGLISRIMPQHKTSVDCRLNVKAIKPYFKIFKFGQKLVVEGNSPVSIASGLHRYMKDYLNVSVSWTDFTPVLPDKLPLPSKVIKEESPYEFVTYMNYCTFGYTTVYWDWERWEKEIDWMALHGVTHPLSMVGVEQVWRNFLARIGYTEEETKKFLTGPVYLPWLLMGNMEALGGPMPDEWFEKQVALQHKILDRMRSYGMEPIFQAFYGMVPSGYKAKYPNATVVEQGKWNTFDRPDVLSPLDPEFDRLARIWYDEYTALFGKTDYYAGDLFHEGGKTGGLDVTACARSVEKAMLTFKPDAVWVLQSWGPNPVPELLKGLSPEHALVVELCAEYWHRWKDNGGYDGIPWAWSNISNWGGNIGLHGRLDAIASEPLDALHDKQASKTLIGIGFTPEGIETNPVVPALWSDMVWNSKTLDMEQWIQKYAQYRYHSVLPSLQESWNGFYKTVYGTYPGSRRPSEPVFCAEPSLGVKTVSSWSQCKIYYDPNLFADACKTFLQDASALKGNKNYEYDVVDMVRQYISDLGRSSYARIQEAWKNRNRELFDKETKRFLQLIKDQDRLLLSHPAFCLQSWLESARSAGSTPGIKSQYEYYNKLIVTSWDTVDGSLNDYTHRELGGLLGTYYYKRWSLYFNYLNQAWDNPSLPEPYMFGVTKTWLYEKLGDTILSSSNNPVDTASEIFNKYYQ